ncbi:probable cytochrome P450 313a4 [Eurosta solidaginis]|uniref:probable cytochrome P450 313a4 n=1 Tax=Eurosta solidaginis TaxID=178769 RepID=UPI003531413F
MALRLMNREEILQAFRNEEKKFGQTFFSWLGPYPFLVVGDPHIAQEILNSPHCIDKSFIYNALDDGTGKGLFSLANPKWKVHRRLLNPAFGYKVLLTFLPIFNDEVNKFLENLEKLSFQEVDLTKLVPNLTLKIAIQTTMSGMLPLDGKNNVYEELLRCYKCVQESMTEMCFSPWLRIKVLKWLWRNYSSYTEAKSKIRKYIRQVMDMAKNQKPFGWLWYGYGCCGCGGNGEDVVVIWRRVDDSGGAMMMMTVWLYLAAVAIRVDGGTSLVFSQWWDNFDCQLASV